MLATTGSTDDPYLAAIIQARHIFLVTGIPTKPWEVDDWPDDWLDAIEAYMVRYPDKKRRLDNSIGK